jgi:Fur family transcriptional regulator, zinc uptake regulator
MNNSQIVLNIITKSKKPLTAYLILDKFQKIKKVQPMSVYRALNKLIEVGKVHKSNQNKTFILCNHNHAETHNPSIAICKSCGNTQELISSAFTNIFSKLSLKNFDFKNFELEVSTLCKKCIS